MRDRLRVGVLYPWIVACVVGSTAFAVNQAEIPTVASRSSASMQRPVVPPVAIAVPGDLLRTVNVPVPSPGCCGIGIELDGSGRVVYTNTDDCNLRFTDLDGNDLGALPLIDDGSGRFNCPTDGPNAIAFNANDGFMYAGGWSSTNIYKINLSTGVVTLHKPNAIPGAFGFIDGLAWDPTDNSFWMSDDTQCEISHLDSNGDPHPDGRDFDGCTVTTHANSGLAISKNGTMWYGTNGDGLIYQLDPTTDPPTDDGVFSSPGGRDEDMVCGPLFEKPDGSIVETLLSKDAHADFFVVIEAPDGSCEVVTSLDPPVIRCAECERCADPGTCEVTVDCDPGIGICLDREDGTDVTTSCLPPGPYPVGPNDVEFTCEDQDGDVSVETCSFTVRDCEPPVCLAPADLALECSARGGVPGSDPAIVAWLATADGDDNCSAPTIDSVVPPFFASGCGAGATTQVAFTATDDAGYQDTCTGAVTVVDTTPPVLVVPPPLELECTGPDGVAADSCAVQAWLGSATAADVCFEAAVVNDAPTSFPVDCAGGVTDVLFTATDSCGNGLSEVSQVTIVDTIGPEIIGCGLLPVLPPAPPVGSSSVASINSETTFVEVVCGDTFDACSEPVTSAAQVVVRGYEVVDGMCVPTEERIDVTCGEILEVQLLAPPCPARPASSAPEPTSEISEVIAGESIELVVTASDSCGNEGACTAEASGLCFGTPVAEACEEPLCGSLPLTERDLGAVPPPPPKMTPQPRPPS